jgi:hypothetical protein
MSEEVGGVEERGAPSGPSARNRRLASPLGSLARSLDPVACGVLAIAAAAACGRAELDAMDEQVASTGRGGSTAAFGAGGPVDAAGGSAGSGPFVDAGADADAGCPGAGNGQTVSAGSAHTCAIDACGGVWCWGQGQEGQLGDGTFNTFSNAPVAVVGLPSRAVFVASGGWHSCAILEDGTLWCWGSHFASTPKPIPEQVSALGVAVTAVAAGYWAGPGGAASYTCARTADATLWCWGNAVPFSDGLATDVSSPLPERALAGEVAWFATGSTHVCAGTAAGLLWCWYDDLPGNGGAVHLVELPGSWKAVAAGVASICAIRVDGTVSCWAYPPEPVEVASGMSAVAVGDSFGGFHACAIKLDGTLWCWGANAAGQLGDGSTTDAIRPVQVTALGANVLAVTAGFAHTCARTLDGRVWCWGDWQTGPFDGDASDGSSTPVQVPFP